MTKSLDVIIVNWNAGPQLRSCLESITAVDLSTIDLQRVVVVDNASIDGSASGLEDIALPITVMHNMENRGFGAACNQGARGSTADYLLFLNPDTRLMSASLAKPLDFFESAGGAHVGTVGIQLLDDTGRVARTCARFPTTCGFLAKVLAIDRIMPTWFPSHFMTEWDHATTREVDQVIGAFYLIRRQLFSELGGFDERFFVYFEEVDLSLRAKRAGWRTVYLADVQAYHKGGGTSEQIKAARLFYSLRSRIQYGCKHFGLGSATLLIVVTSVFEPIARLALAVARGARSEVLETKKGFSMLWRELPLLCRDLLNSGRRGL